MTQYLTAEEEYALIRRAQAGDESAAEELLECHVAYVHYLSRKWWHKVREYFEYEDCFQEALAGSLRAVLKFDVERGVKFTTYMTWWAKQALGRMRESATVVHQPVHVKGFTRVTSLDMHVGDFNVTLKDLIVDHKADSDKDSLAAGSEAKKFLEPLLKRLLPRHRRILELRYSGHTLEEVGRELQITRERVRQLETKALNKLVQIARESGITYEGHDPVDNPERPRDAKYVLPDYDDWIPEPEPPPPDLTRGIIFVREKKRKVAEYYLSHGCTLKQIEYITGCSTAMLKKWFKNEQ